MHACACCTSPTPSAPRSSRQSTRALTRCVKAKKWLGLVSLPLITNAALHSQQHVLHARTHTHTHTHTHAVHTAASLSLVSSWEFQRVYGRQRHCSCLIGRDQERRPRNRRRVGGEVGCPRSLGAGHGTRTCPSSHDRRTPPVPPARTGEPPTWVTTLVVVTEMISGHSETLNPRQMDSTTLSST